MKMEIQLTSFYSHGDERRFFQGLDDIDCIENVKGIGRGLAFDINLNRFSKEKVFEFIALLWRYQIDLTPIRLLAERRKKFAWLRENQYYWHECMYPPNSKHDSENANITSSID
ncbi:hypothetical protein [Chromobacterium violaceum]|uniref:Uncharacterized protein n=1 Tax=Chromobacterium violaceum (strain ATCC 12472 / DSM 30191 / JCM 1249 / CCUG 213 / NBRC 12614 / NCIMB 9131 / NCTC 9757 / MK) TaxID=243365 RepID=Q7NYN3_CHRVO|nr:hypothetical protein [Chromobacterium violaceum]AAQ58915.1 hypothetical protein CV_1240 [Chromobacterium violaceum ATCC 12472]